MNLRTSWLVRAFAALGAALLATALMATPARAAEGDPRISYDGAQNVLTVEGGTGSATVTDLFASFKGVVPGDSITQNVDIDLAHISAQTRLYIQADTSRLTEKQREVLGQMQLAVSFAGEGIVAGAQQGAPSAVFASTDPVLIATVEGPATATTTLTLTVPTTVGNELAEMQEAVIPWIITIEEEDGTGDSTAITPHAMDLVAYEGGMGTNASAGSVGNALPDPEWTNVDWETARVTVANQEWNESNPYWGTGTAGLPFRWAYGTVAQDPALVTTSARAGVYYLLAAPLEGKDGEVAPVVTVNGKLLTLPDDYVVTLDDGLSDVIVRVRDVTSNDAADALATSHFKDVYGGEASALSLTSLFAAAVSAAYADDPATLSSALAGEFTGLGTHGGSCDASQPHAHVEAGTSFVKNGYLDVPVNDDARIGLLWDDFIPGVLGVEGRESVLDGKARTAAGGSFATSDAVQRRFKYIDLVDMNDGNLWVSTADQSAVTVFVPYFEGIAPEDQIAVVRFDGLTRDYTLDMSQTDLDALVAGTSAYTVPVTRASDGFYFEVPWSEFGPFELLWIDADAQGGGQPIDDDDTTKKPHGDLLQTGDNTLLCLGALAAAAVVLIVAGLLLRRRHRD